MEYLLHINKDVTSICDSSLPKCEFLGYSVSNRGGAPCPLPHKEFKNVSQSFTGGLGQVISLRQTLMYK